MTKHRYALLVLTTCTIVPGSASAQDTLPLDPSVYTVVTGGSWERTKERGHYRIIVWSGGWEHVASKLRVEWILEDPVKQENRVLTSAAVDSIADWVWSLGQPNLACSPRSCLFTIRGTEPHVLEEASWTITLRGPGQMSVVKRR